MHSVVLDDMELISKGPKETGVLIVCRVLSRAQRDRGSDSLYSLMKGPKGPGSVIPCSLLKGPNRPGFWNSDQGSGILHGLLKGPIRLGFWNSVQSSQGTKGTGVPEC